jgi:hypothetical protein
MNSYETIYKQIIGDSAYVANLDWGQARPGHPEGSIRAHIEELEGNLDRLKPQISEDQFWKLRVILHTHDSFKAEAERGVPIRHPKSHASLARQFLAKYTEDADILHMVQYHDEPFALWRQFKQKGSFTADRLDALLSAIGDWDLFLLFQLVDGLTDGKDAEPLSWFFEVVRGKVRTSIEPTLANTIKPNLQVSLGSEAQQS